jgi:two-component system alkaline phosphatase synthesis response regulator PhoP
MRRRTHILIVDDEKDILDLLRYNLQKEGYTVTTASTGRKALDLVHRSEPPDLIVLDVMMPEMDGWEVCRILKRDQKTASIPVIFLTAKGTEVDEVVGLELGAEDYVVKPVSPRTFVARVKAMLRRTSSSENFKNEREILRAGNLEVNVANYTVSLNNKELFFPRKEFETLVYLMKHPDRVLTREAILNAVWGSDIVVGDRTVDVHIRRIREKLGTHASFIETVKGVGYRFRS